MFFDVKDFCFLEDLGSQWKSIRDEYLALPSPCLSEWIEKDLYHGAWKIFLIFADGKFTSDAARLCPITCAGLKRVPGLTVAGFSVLSSNTEIIPHEGHTLRVLRYHLGLVTSENAGIQVGDQIQIYQDGEHFVFNDRVTHHAWNRDSSSRAILLVDFERPEKFRPLGFGQEASLFSKKNLETFLKSVN